MIYIYQKSAVRVGFNGEILQENPSRCLLALLLLTGILRVLEKEMPMSLGFVPKALIQAALTRLHICRKALPLVLCPPFGLDTGLLCALNVPIFQLLLQAK